MNRSRTSVVIAVIAAAVLLPASGASALPGPVPSPPAQDPAEAGTTLLVSVESVRHLAVRTAFEAIPGQDHGHITQVLKNLDMGLL